MKPRGWVWGGGEARKCLRGEGRRARVCHSQTKPDFSSSCLSAKAATPVQLLPTRPVLLCCELNLPPDEGKEKAYYKICHYTKKNTPLYKKPRYISGCTNRGLRVTSSSSQLGSTQAFPRYTSVAFSTLRGLIPSRFYTSGVFLPEWKLSKKKIHKRKHKPKWPQHNCCFRTLPLANSRSARLLHMLFSSSNQVYKTKSDLSHSILNAALFQICRTTNTAEYSRANSSLSWWAATGRAGDAWARTGMKNCFSAEAVK